MKKFYSLLICLALCLISFPTAIAVESDTSKLASIASQNITVSVQGNETTYSNLQQFYSVARKELPTVSDMQLAEYVLDYIGQPYDRLSDETILETLGFLEISSVDQVFRALPNGDLEELSTQEIDTLLNSAAAPLADWTSNDGALRISTYAYKEAATKDGIPYVLFATASWLKFPVFRFTDTFAIVHGGVFDDSYAVTATFIEEGVCSECGKKFKWDERERYAPPGSGLQTERSDLIELDYSQSHAVGAKYDLKLISCSHHLVGEDSPRDCASTTQIYSTIRFRSIITGLTEAQAAYAHAKIGIQCTISGSVNGSSVKPNFSSLVALDRETYTPPPVTLRYN